MEAAGCRNDAQAHQMLIAESRKKREVHEVDIDILRQQREDIEKSVKATQDQLERASAEELPALSRTLDKYRRDAHMVDIQIADQKVHMRVLDDHISMQTANRNALLWAAERYEAEARQYDAIAEQIEVQARNQ